MKIKGVREEEVRQFIEKNYEIEIENISYHPIGENGASYIIKTKNKKHFAKVFSKDPGVRKSIREIKIFIDFLYRIKNEDDFAYISTPIRNNHQNLISKFKGFAVILEDFIPGKSPRNLSQRDYAKIGEILGKLHNINPKKFRKIKEDILNLKWESKILKIIKKLKKTEKLSSGEKKLRTILSKKEETFKRAIKFLKENVKKIKARKDEYVLVHEDLHSGNLLQNKDEIFFIDWEGLKLALPERDLIWFRKGLGLRASVEKGYKKSLKKNYKIDNQTMKFYLIKRLLSDTTYFSQGIITRKESVREARSYLEEIRNEIEELEQVL